MIPVYHNFSLIFLGLSIIPTDTNYIILTMLIFLNNTYYIKKVRIQNKKTVGQMIKHSALYKPTEARKSLRTFLEICFYLSLNRSVLSMKQQV